MTWGPKRTWMNLILSIKVLLISLVYSTNWTCSKSLLRSLEWMTNESSSKRTWVKKRGRNYGCSVYKKKYKRMNKRRTRKGRALALALSEICAEILMKWYAIHHNKWLIVNWSYRIRIWVRSNYCRRSVEATTDQAHLYRNLSESQIWALNK